MEEDKKNLLATTIEDLRHVRELLPTGNVPLAISELWSINDVYANYKFQEKLTSINTDFNMMKKYWKQGVEDSQRNAMFSKIRHDIDDLVCEMEMERMKCEMPFFKDCRRRIATSGVDFTLTEVKSRLEAFVSDFAMTELLPDDKKKARLQELHTKHQDYLNLIFDYILSIGCMTKIDAEGWADIMIAPTIDASDRQLLMAAMVINLQNVPQLAKMRCMMDIYQRAEDGSARQTALVGWTLALRYEQMVIDEQLRKDITDIFNAPEHTIDIMSLQLQVFMAMNAEKDSKTLDAEFNKVRLTNEYRKIADQLEGNDVDHSLDDVLNAGEINAKMDEWVESLTKLSDMRKRGSDLFFNSFAQLKNMGFFSKPANWFVHFYIEHPDIKTSVNVHPKITKFLKVFTSMPLLSTDKYSFVMFSAKMAKRLPPELIDSAFNKYPDDFEMPESTTENEDVVIRDCLMKLLYRFYKLFTHRGCFDSPFEKKALAGYRSMPYLFMANKICGGTFLVKNILSICKSIYKMGHKEEICFLIDRSRGILHSTPETTDGFDFLYFWGAYCHEMSHYDCSRLPNNLNFELDAIISLRLALELSPGNASVKRRLVKLYHERNLHKETKELAEDLLHDSPDDPDLLSIYAMSLYHLGEQDEAEKVFFKLVYLYPDSQGAIAYMPEVLVKSQKFEQAKKIVNGWIGKGFGDTFHSLYKWMAVCCYDQGKMEAATNWFAQYFMSKQDVNSQKKATSGGTPTYSVSNADENLYEEVKSIIQEDVKDCDTDNVNLSLLVGCITDRINEMNTQHKVEDDSLTGME